MSSIFEKLNAKGLSELLVLNAPASFEAQLAPLPPGMVVRRLQDCGDSLFALTFVTHRKELDRLSRLLAAHSRGDVALWFAYPKGTSKNYTCDFNRDDGWEVLRSAGFDSVRMVAIDADWSALRFRRVEFIKRAGR